MRSTSCRRSRGLGIEMPETVNGYTQHPLEGVSLRYTFDDADAPTQKETQFYSMLGTRAIWHKGWKAVTAVPAAPDRGVISTSRTGSCSIPSPIRARCTDLAEKHPEKLQELVALWWAEAGRLQALPLESRSAIEILGTDAAAHGTEVPYIYYPGGAELPESVAPNIRNRSYTIAAEVEIETEGAEGVLAPKAPGSAVIALRQGRQAHLRLQLRGRARPGGRVRRDRPNRSRRALRHFDKEGDGMPTQGTHHASHPGQGRWVGNRSKPSRASSGLAAVAWSSVAPGPSR